MTKPAVLHHKVSQNRKYCSDVFFLETKKTLMSGLKRNVSVNNVLEHTGCLFWILVPLMNVIPTLVVPKITINESTVAHRHIPVILHLHCLWWAFNKNYTCKSKKHKRRTSNTLTHCTQGYLTRTCMQQDEHTTTEAHMYSNV